MVSTSGTAIRSSSVCMRASCFSRAFSFFSMSLRHSSRCSFSIFMRFANDVFGKTSSVSVVMRRQPRVSVWRVVISMLSVSWLMSSVSRNQYVTVSPFSEYSAMLHASEPLLASMPSGALSSRSDGSMPMFSESLNFSRLSVLIGAVKKNVMWSSSLRSAFRKYRSVGICKNERSTISSGMK